MSKLLSDAWVVAQIQLIAVRRAAAAYIIIFTLFPLSFLFFAKNLVPPGSPVGTRLITGSIVFALGLSIVNELAQNLLFARFNNQLKLIIVAPVNKVSFAAGMVVSGVLRGVLSTYIVLVFAPLFGIHIDLSLWLVPLSLLAALSLTGVALVVGTWAPSQQVGNLLANTVGILIVVFSPIYYPVSRLPEALRWPARLSPYTHAANAIDGVLSGAGGFYGEMGVLAGITAAALALGLYGMRWRDV